MQGVWRNCKAIGLTNCSSYVKMQPVGRLLGRAVAPQICLVLKEAPHRTKVRLFLYVRKTQSDNADEYNKELKQLVICNHSITSVWRNNPPPGQLQLHITINVEICRIKLTIFPISVTLALEAPK